MKINKVYLVGAGPGDPGLISVKGLEILRQADVLIYDYLVDKRLLDEAKAGAELICCDKLGRNRHSDGFLIHNGKISQLVIKKARQGKKVIRLKNGDPAIFSRTPQELEPLVKNKIEFEIVPGITSGCAAADLSGIPLTDRRFASTCVFVTGHEDPAKKNSLLDWESLSRSGTIVLYMAVENLPKITRYLISAGKPPATAAAVIQDAGLLTQKTTIATLVDIAEKTKGQKIKPPAVIIIGGVVKLERNFNWFKKTKRILFTGISSQRFFEKGTVFHLPLIKIEPLKSYKEFDSLLKDIYAYDWVVFTSRYGVEYFFKRLKALGYDLRSLSTVKIAAIGNSTKEKLEDSGALADLVAKKESSKGLLDEFKKIDIKDKRIFLPRSDISDKGLADGLGKLGARVVAGVAYRNVMPGGLPDLDLHFFNEIRFTSPSGVRNFIKRYGRLPKEVKASCIGEVTLKEAKRWHLLN